MRTTFVMGNWKMNGNSASISALIRSLKEQLPEHLQRNTVVFPPSIFMPLVQQHLSQSSIAWGAQNCHPNDSGAFTGEVSIPMLKEFHCRYVLVGHSERRHLFGENESFIAKKFHHAKDHDMIPVLCVGETLAEREQGLTKTVIARQIQSVMHEKNDVFSRCVIAYEPVWAIGTGKTASAAEAQDAHAHIRQLIADVEPGNAAHVSILYGGSVNEANASALFSMPDVDGGLVGGASLNAQQFVEIVKCIS